MLKCLKNGLAKIETNEVSIIINNLIDAPINIIEAIKAELNDQYEEVGCRLYAEDSMISIIFTPYISYLIIEENKPILYTIDKDSLEIAEEIYHDFSDSINEWLNDFYGSDCNTLDEKKNELVDCLTSLKESIDLAKKQQELEPELGNLLWGYSRGEYRVSRGVIEELFCKFLEDIGCDNYGFAISENAKKFENNRGGITTDKFIIRPYYWGDDESEMVLPNFEYKPDNFSIMWYKYPMRDAYSNKEFSMDKFKQILDDCRKVME